MPRQVHFIEPCLPTLRRSPPKGAGWAHEVKFDGYRIQLHKRGPEAVVYSKNGMDFSARFPAMVPVVHALPVKSAIIDGEIVAENAKGMPEFYALHARRAAADALMMWAFDLLELNGANLRSLPLSKRRQKLERLVVKAGVAPLRFSVAFDDPEKLLDAYAKHQLEGIVSKRTDRPYVSGTTTSWIKVKCQACREANRELFKLFAKP